MSVKRVLIFDSGVGGLSVYEQVIKLNPAIKCHYLFDNAYFPYGELPRSKLIKRLTQLLADFMAIYTVDLVVIACNSASTIALSALRTHFSVPIVGVVPAIKPAASISRNNIIGLLATPATIERCYTEQLINEFAADKTVLRIGSTELVKLAEDKLMGKLIVQGEVKKILAPWLTSPLNMPDTLVLGCTHFPLMASEIQACFPKPIQLVDSGFAIAVRVKELLKTADNVMVQSGGMTGKNNAFYTQRFTESIDLNALRQCFYEYGFEQISYCELNAEENNR